MYYYNTRTVVFWFYVSGSGSEQRGTIYEAALKHIIAKKKTDQLLTNQENSCIQTCEKPQLI